MPGAVRNADAAAGAAAVEVVSIPRSGRHHGRNATRSSRLFPGRSGEAADHQRRHTRNSGRGEKCAPPPVRKRSFRRKFRICSIFHFSFLRPVKSECAEAADAHAVHTADAARGIEFPSANVNTARFADFHAHAALHALRRIEPQWCERPFREHRKQPAGRAERVAEHPPPARRREQDRQQNHARQNRQRQRELRPRLKRLNCLDPPVKLVVHLRKQRLSRSGRIPAEERIRVEQTRAETSSRRPQGRSE